jgi:hypothetical protein
VCDTDNPVFYRMRNVAATCLLLYGMGVPAFFAGFVFKYVGMHCASFVCLASPPCITRTYMQNVGLGVVALRCRPWTCWVRVLHAFLPSHSQHGHVCTMLGAVVSRSRPWHSLV